MKASILMIALVLVLKTGSSLEASCPNCGDDGKKLEYLACDKCK